MIDLIRSRLADMSVPVFDSFVTDEELQASYVLIVAPGLERGGDESLDGGPSSVDLIVRAVGVTPGQVRALVEATRARLRGVRGLSGGKWWSFHWDGSPRPVQADQQSKNSLGTFPVWLDDEYTVYAEKV